MIKRILFIGIILFLAVWARPAEAGCRYSYECTSGSYPGNYYSSSYYNPNYDPVFGDWYGVDNRNVTNNPFGDWYGVNNMGSVNDPLGLGQWYGVNNSQSINNPFGGWYGVNNMGSTNTMGNWYGVSSSAPTYYSTTPRQTSYQTAAAYPYGSAQPVNYSSQYTNTYRVAPETGIDKTAPFAFAGLLAAGFFVFRQRKWLFT